MDSDPLCLYIDYPQVNGIPIAARRMSSPTRTDDELAYVREGIGDELDTMLVFNLLRTHSYLGQFIDADLRGQRLTAAQFNVLLVLNAAPDGRMQMGEVGRRLVVTKGNVTGLIDRLAREGLVERAECRDRRATWARLTDAGRDLLGSIAPGHARLLAQLTDDLTTREKQSLVRLLSKLRRALRGRRQAIQSGTEPNPS